MNSTREYRTNFDSYKVAGGEDERGKKLYLLGRDGREMTQKGNSTNFNLREIRVGSVGGGEKKTS